MILGNERQVVFYRAREIQEMYKLTHFTFFHSQNMEYSFLNDIIYMFCKKSFSNKHVHMKSHQLFCSQRLVTKPRYKTARNFLEVKWNSQINDHNLRQELVCVSERLKLNGAEGALDYFRKDHNVANFCSVVEIVLKRMYMLLTAREFVPKSVQLRNLVKSIVTIATHKRKQSSAGQLVAFIIPKKLTEDPNKTIVYRSHPYGVPCKCNYRSPLVLNEGTDLVTLDPLVCKENNPPQFR